MLAYLDATDLDNVDDWARQHYEWHVAIFNAAEQQGYPHYSTYAFLRDILGDPEGWAEYHNLEHQAIAGSLQTGEVFDLSEIDFQDKDSLDSWLEVHSEIHVDLRNQLKL